MPLFPLFVDLKGKKCVVIGAGDTAMRKISILRRFEADIQVIAPNVSEMSQGSEKYTSDHYDVEYIEDAYLVIAATDDVRVNARIYEDAVSRDIHVNVVDDPLKCTFYFPSVITRGDLVIGISSSGAYPILTKKTREKIDLVIPGYYAGLTALLKRTRKIIRNRIPCQDDRKELLGIIFDRFLLDAENGDMDIPDDDLEDIITEVIIEKNNKGRNKG